MALVSAKRSIRVKAAWGQDNTYSPAALAAIFAQWTPTVYLPSPGGDYDWLLVTNAARLVDWTYCGIPGGIPSRTNIYQNLGVSGQSPTYVQSVTTSQIQTAIDNCPDAQVVYLYPGTYNNIGDLQLYNNDMVLRGAGPGQTIVNFTGQGFETRDQSWSQDPESVGGSETPIASGYTKGSTTITFSSTPPSGISVGNLIYFRQDDNTALVRGAFGATSNQRALAFIARVTAVNGNNVSFVPPIPYTLSAGYNPGVAYLNGTHSTLIGVENMTATFGGAGVMWRMIAADRCWLKNCDFKNWSNYGVWIYHSFQCEVRRCFFHDATGWESGTMADGYPVYLYDGSSCCRIEDNISYRTGVWINSRQSFNAFLYNHAYYSMHYSTTRQVGMVNVNHGAHGLMSLWEGNVAEQLENDGYHGSTSHQMLFRNWINGLHPVASWNRIMLNMSRGSYYHTAVGNVLGDSSWTPAAYEMSGDQDYSYSVIYRIGYPNMEANSLTEEHAWPGYGLTYPDPGVVATLLRHGNYDYSHNAAVWDSGITSHEIPASLIYASKPSYFGSLVWPPIGPDVSGYHTSTPARHRWLNYVASGYSNLSTIFADET